MKNLSRFEIARKHFSPYGFLPGAIAILAVVAALVLPDSRAPAGDKRSVLVHTSAPAQSAQLVPTVVPDAKVVFGGQIHMPEEPALTF